MSLPAANLRTRRALLAVALFLLPAIPAGAQRSGDSNVVAQNPIAVGQGRSRLVTAPWKVARVSIAQPEIADVQVLSPTQVLVFGKTIGATDLFLFGDDELAWQARVEVQPDLSSLKSELARMFPRSQLEVAQSRDVLVVSGALERTDDVPQLHAFFEAHATKYLDLTKVTGVQQVLLQVRVAEVSRRAIRALGINGFHANDNFIGGVTLGSSGGGPLAPINIGVPSGSSALGDLPFSFIGDTGLSPGITMFAAFPHSDIALFLQALSENQYLRILAQPNLVAMSGEEASFLAGGEFPIPVAQGNVGGVGSSITIEWKEFGVRLRFRPLVLGDNRIRLFVAPEVSDLTDSGAVEIQGFRVPALVTRRAETTLELKSGQMFAMAGLLNNVTTGRASSIPLLGDLPILGPLFRSVRYESGDTELVVLVTASLAEPTNVTDVPYPGITHKTPSDWQLYVTGTLDGGSPADLPDAERNWFRAHGFDRLKGPGAWAPSGPAPGNHTATEEQR